MRNASEPSGFPRRPTRLERVLADLTPLYFITFNTFKRASVLAHAEVHAEFVQYCQRARSYQIAVGRYVIMADHVHLFVAMPEAGSISLGQWIGTLKNTLGKRLLKLGVHKPHWQEGFFDHLLRHEESHAQKWEYVRLNPVRAGLCRQPQDWPYKGEIVAL